MLSKGLLPAPFKQSKVLDSENERVLIPNELRINRFRPATGQMVRCLQFAPFKACPLAERKAYRANARGAATAPTQVLIAVHTFSTSRVVDKNGTQSALGVCCLPSIAVVAICIAVLRFSYDDFRKHNCFPP